MKRIVAILALAAVLGFGCIWKKQPPAPAPPPASIYPDSGGVSPPFSNSGPPATGPALNAPYGAPNSASVPWNGPLPAPQGPNFAGQPIQPEVVPPGNMVPPPYQTA